MEMEYAMFVSLRNWINRAGLGPAGVTVDDVHGDEVLKVSLFQDKRRCRTLRRWTRGPLDVIDVTLGRYSDNDSLRRLNVRGRITTLHGDTVLGVIVCPFVVAHDVVPRDVVAHDRSQVDVIHQRIDRWNPQPLIDELARRELAAAQTRR